MNKIKNFIKESLEKLKKLKIETRNYLNNK